MAKKKEKEQNYDGGYTPSGGRKFNLFAFILCVLVALIIWLVSTNREKIKQTEPPEVETAGIVSELSPDML